LDAPLAEPVIRFMKEENINVAENTRTQVTAKMEKEFDKVIVIAESETIPDYLSESEKSEFWDVKDPKGMDDQNFKEIVDQIKLRVRKFILSHN